jgi:hypothetical protein
VRTRRALIKPDVARTIQRARDEQSRAHELCRTAADTLRETGVSYRQLMAVRLLTRSDTAAPPPRHGVTSLASEERG